MHFSFPSDLKKTTAVVESLSTNTTKCTVPENSSLLQDLINSMRNLRQMQEKLDTLLAEFVTQFAKDETSIGKTPLTKMTINTGNSDSVSQKPYPITMKNYQWAKEESYSQPRSSAAADPVGQHL